MDRLRRPVFGGARHGDPHPVVEVDGGALAVPRSPARCRHGSRVPLVSDRCPLMGGAEAVHRPDCRLPRSSVTVTISVTTDPLLRCELLKACDAVFSPSAGRNRAPTVVVAVPTLCLAECQVHLGDS